MYRKRIFYDLCTLAASLAVDVVVVVVVGGGELEGTQGLWENKQGVAATR